MGAFPNLTLADVGHGVHHRELKMTVISYLRGGRNLVNRLVKATGRNASRIGSRRLLSLPRAMIPIRDGRVYQPLLLRANSSRRYYGFIVQINSILFRLISPKHYFDVG